MLDDDEGAGAGELNDLLELELELFGVEEELELFGAEENEREELEELEDLLPDEKERLPLLKPPPLAA